MSALAAVIGHGTPMQITWWQDCIRAIIIFVYGIVLLRLFGRRAFGHHTPLDILLSVLIGSNLSRAMTGGAPFLPTMASSAMLLLMYYAAIHVTQRCDSIGRVLKGKPVVLLRDGVPDQAAMRATGVSHLDLEEAARSEKIRSTSEVEIATLERSGKISVVERGD
jgi:uncharacterized membrane protein YcaP (DUF421 family)